MLLIELHKISATWDEDELVWVSSDKNIAMWLNTTVPEDIGLVDVPFRDGGAQGMALTAARQHFGTDLEVVKETPPEVPAEREGIDY